MFSGKPSMISRRKGGTDQSRRRGLGIREKQGQEFASFQIQLFGEQSQTRLLTLQQALEEQTITETHYAEQVGGIKLDQLNQQLALYGDIKSAAYDENKVLIIGEQITQQTLDNLIEQNKVTKKLKESLQDVITKEQERFNIILQQQQAEGAGVLDRDKPTAVVGRDRGAIEQGLGGVFGAISDTDRNGDIKSQAQFMTDVWADAADGITQSIGSITGAMSDMLVQMIVTGEMSGKAALQMAAGVALGLAMQAGIKAIFEVAEGIAAAANPFTAWQAPMHFAAAKTYAIVAAVAGGAGVGLALGARAMGGGQSKSGKSSSGIQT
jgi:hypothetical protein